MASMQSPVVENDRNLGGIHYVLARSAELHPDRVAILDLHDKISVTYKQLHTTTNRLARALRRLGIKKGDLVALMFGNELAIIEAMFACAKIGAIMCPVNARLLPHEVQAYLEHHGKIGIAAFRERVWPYV